MAQKKSNETPAGQTNLFDLFGLSTAAAVVSAPPPPPPPAPVPEKPAGPMLPDGWTVDDIRFLLQVLEEGPVLVADTELGIPTIHSNFGAEVEHCGFGLMIVKGMGYKLNFDAGGAMKRTPSGKGWSHLFIEGKYPYDTQAVRKKLEAYLSKDDAPQAADIPPALAEEPERDYVAERKATTLKFIEERKRDQGLPQYMVAMEDVDKLPFTTEDESLIKVYCVGRDVELVTGEVITISGFFGSKGGNYIETLQPGENMIPPEVELNLEPGRDRYIHKSFLRGVLLDENQEAELGKDIRQLFEMAKPWPAEDETKPEAAPAKLTVEDQAKAFRSSLGYFTGTEKWTRYPGLCPHIILLTDGAMHVAEHGGEDGNSAFWLMDAIASYQGEAALKHHEFQVWKLVIHPPDEPGPAQNTVMAVLQSKPGHAPEKPFNPHRHASLICTNGNEKELVRQEIDMTDFLPVGEVTLYASVEEHPDVSTKQKVMIVLLSSEY
jgi:hypothetical protein